MLVSIHTDHKNLFLLLPFLGLFLSRVLMEGAETGEEKVAQEIDEAPCGCRDLLHRIHEKGNRFHRTPCPNTNHTGHGPRKNISQQKQSDLLEITTTELAHHLRGVGGGGGLFQQTGPSTCVLIGSGGVGGDGMDGVQGGRVVVAGDGVLGITTGSAAFGVVMVVGQGWLAVDAQEGGMTGLIGIRGDGVHVGAGGCGGG